MTPTTYGRDFAYCLKSHGGVRGFNASLWRFLLRCTLFCHSVATFLTSVSSYEGGCGFEVIVAYKPNEKELKKLKEADYQVFARNIKKVGYEVKTNKRVKYFSPTYKINYETFDIEIDSNGNALIDEEFSATIAEFKNWCLGQEKQLQDIFIKAK